MNAIRASNEHRELPSHTLRITHRAENGATTIGLLDRLDRPNNQMAWGEFDFRYRPIVVAVARRLGLCMSDADDVAQQTMIAFLREWSAGRYDPSRGRVRTWMLAVVRHRVIDCIRARQRMRGLAGETLAELVPAHELERTWDDSSRQAILIEALDYLRSASRTESKTIDAFERFAIHAVPAEVVAEEFGLETAEVYRIKSRIVKRLREMVESIEGQ